MAILRASFRLLSISRWRLASRFASWVLCSPRTLSMVLRPRNFSSRVGVAASSGGSAAGGSMVVCSVQHPVGSFVAARGDGFAARAAQRVPEQCGADRWWRLGAFVPR